MDPMLEVKKGELTFIYNSDIFRDREALGYATSLKDHKVREVDVAKEQLTEQQLMDLAYRLDKSPEDLMDKQSSPYKKEYAGKNLDEEDILKSIRRTPHLLKTPIAVFHDKAYVVASPYDFVKKGMRVEGIKERVDEKNKDH